MGDQPEAFTDYKQPITSHSSESPPALPKLRMLKSHQGQAERPSLIHALGWLNISLLGGAPNPDDNENITENVIAKTHPLTQSVAQLLREGLILSSNEYLSDAFFDRAFSTNPSGDDLIIKMRRSQGMIYDLKLEITGGVLKGELQLTKTNGSQTAFKFKGTILVKPKESVPLHHRTMSLGTVNIVEGFKPDALEKKDCPVCLDSKELEQNPGCGHSFCKACIHTMRKMRRQEEEVKCPLCRKKLPAGYCNLIWSVGDVPAPSDIPSDSSDTDSELSDTEVTGNGVITGMVGAFVMGLGIAEVGAFVMGLG